jgi:hypothetical protein
MNTKGLPQSMGEQRGQTPCLRPTKAFGHNHMHSQEWGLTHFL